MIDSGPQAIAGTALLVVVAVFVFTAIIAHTAGALNILDEKRKHAEQGLIRGEKLAAAGRLSATMAHEINNPLAAVMNLLYLASTRATDDTTADYIRAAEKQLLRASETAKRTLGFYRDDAQPAHVSLSALAEEVLDVFRGNLMKKHVEITTDFQSPAIVEARPWEIRQIIANLVGNALDAVQTSEQPHISLAVREQQGVAEFVVRDNGCGIASDHLQKIFEPFFTTKKDVGNGLGLYVSNQLAERNGGGLHVNSSTQRGASGATFVLTLPMARVSSAASGEPHAARVETDVMKRRTTAH